MAVAPIWTLQLRARLERRPTDELLVLYILERFLYRLASSEYRSRLLLKGGMLLAALDERRPTADVDLGLLSYPLETVLAEKIVTMVDRGDTTTRYRDFADVVVLTSRHPIAAVALVAAVNATGAHRGSDLRPLHEVLIALGSTRQADWSRFVARSGLADAVPGSFVETITAVSSF